MIHYFIANCNQRLAFSENRLTLIFNKIINECQWKVYLSDLPILSTLSISSDLPTLVQFFSLTKCLHQHKWWKFFPTNLHHNVLNHIGMVRRFCGLPIIDCYQNRGLVSSTHFWWLSLIHAFTVHEQLSMVVIPCFEFPFRSSIVNKASIGCYRCSFVY